MTTDSLLEQPRSVEHHNDMAAHHDRLTIEVVLCARHEDAKDG